MTSVDEILDYAIEREAEAAQFYADLAGRVDRPWMQELFKSFSKEEEGHKKKLMAVKKGKHLMPAADKVADLKIADYVVDVDTAGELDYQQALIVAMKREKASFRLYTDLAGKTDSEDLRQTFLALAQEEAKHKLRFEVEYDEFVLQEN